MRDPVRLATLPLIVLLGTLTACGGGSGSTSGGGGNDLSLSISPANVTVSATTAQSAPIASIQASVNLLTGESLELVSQYSQSGIASVGISSDTFASAEDTVTIQFKSPATLGPGIYKDTLQISACYTQACTQQVANSPQTVQVQYTVTAAATPTLTNISPSATTAGGTAFSLTASGTNFTSQSVVTWNGAQVPTFFVSATQLTAQISAADIATPASVSVAVTDPANGTSNTLPFTVPVGLASISPSSAPAEGPPFVLTATGAGFTSQSVLMWNGTAVPTTFVSSTQLLAQISAANVASPGSVAVSVANPQAGSSTSLAFTVQPATLTLMSLFPAVVTAGDPAFTLTVTGSAFSGSATVLWNGTALPTTVVSDYSLVAQVSAADIAAAGTASVTVQDAASPLGTTSAQTLTISATSVDSRSFLIDPPHTGAVSFPAVSFPATASWSVDLGGTPSYALIVGGEVFVTVATANGSQLIALDGATGATRWGPVSITGNSNAAYDSGRVFVTSSADTTGASIKAYDAATGASDWSTPVGQNLVGPTAADALVFTTDTGGTVYALNESTGAIAWQQFGRWFGTDSAPAVTADGVYITGACETDDLTPATGAAIWGNNTGCTGAGGATPVVANQLVYSPVEPFGGVILDARTGGTPVSYNFDDPPAFTATMGYFLHFGTLQGVSVPDNTVKWSFTGDGQLTGAPIVINQYVLIGSSSGNLYALDGATGNQVWTQSYGGTALDLVPSGPQLSGLAAGDGLLVVPVGTKLYAYIL